MPVRKIKYMSEGYVKWWCPGCKGYHIVPVQLNTNPLVKVRWTYNEDSFNPTLAPSILIHPVQHEDDPTFRILRCHSFIRNGKIEFCNDCEHELAGQTVDLQDIDDDHHNQET